MDGIETEDERIYETQQIIDSLREATGSVAGNNLVDFLTAPQLNNLLERVRSSEIFGIHEIVPGTKGYPKGFGDWDRGQQVRWLQAVLDFRKKRLERIRHYLKSFGEKGYADAQGDVLKYI